MVQDAMQATYNNHEQQEGSSYHQAKKDPKITEAARKDHNKYTNRLKENILNSQAPEDATKLMSLLLMMLVILKAAYLLAAFTSI